MSELNHNTNLVAAKQRVQSLQEFNSRLVPLRESVAQKGFIVRQLEAAIDEVASQIADLESFSLENLLQSILMRKEKRRDELKTEFTDLETQQESAENELTGLQSQLAQLEAQIAGLAGADVQYQELLDQRTRELMSSEGDSANELRTLTETLEAAKSLRSRLRSAQQVARTSLDRLQTLSTVTSRSRTNFGRVAAGGLVIALAVDVVKRTANTSTNQRAHVGIRELLTTLERIPSEGDGPRDQHLAELVESLRSGSAQLEHASSGAAASLQSGVEQTIHQILANLEERMEACDEGIQMLNQQREQVLENS